jgi:hypothetical protein
VGAVILRQQRHIISPLHVVVAKCSTILGTRKVEAVHITRHAIVKSACQLDKAQFLACFSQVVKKLCICRNRSDRICQHCIEDRADRDGVSGRNRSVREDPASKRQSLGRMEELRVGVALSLLDGPEASLKHRKWLRLNGGAQKAHRRKVTVVACFFGR